MGGTLRSDATVSPHRTGNDITGAKLKVILPVFPDAPANPHAALTSRPISSKAAALTVRRQNLQIRTGIEFLQCNRGANPRPLYIF